MSVDMGSRIKIKILLEYWIINESDVMYLIEELLNF